MASTLKRDIERLGRRIEQSIKAPVQKSELNKIAVQTAQDIKIRTNKGFGVDRPGGPRVKFDPLAQSTIDYRDGHPSLNVGITRASQSNLTFSGQMLESITGKAVSQKKIVIQADNRRRRRPYASKTKRKRKRSTNPTNADVAKAHAASGRTFLNLSSGELRKFIAAVNRQLQKELKRRRLTK